MGERLLRDLAAATDLKPRWTVARGVAYLIAFGVHAVTLALIAGGAVLLVAAFPAPVAIFGGPLLVGIGLIMRPRLPGKTPGHVLPPSTAPAVHALIGRVADALERPAPDLVQVSAEWNASWQVVGLRRCRVLTLGLPLLASLRSQERVAVIAHEVAHDRNGDARRGRLVGSALYALDRLSMVLDPRPDQLGDTGGIVDALAVAVFWLLSRPVEAALWLQARLLLHDIRRAEYLADSLAARVAGTDAVVAAHERLLLGAVLDFAIVRSAQGAQDQDVIATLRRTIAAVPERERERQRRVARLEQSRLEDSHPPTAMRIALLEQRGRLAPAVALDEAASARIDDELRPLERLVNAELVDGYRSALYAG